MGATIKAKLKDLPRECRATKLEKGTIATGSKGALYMVIEMFDPKKDKKVGRFVSLTGMYLCPKHIEARPCIKGERFTLKLENKEAS